MSKQPYPSNQKRKKQYSETKQKSKLTTLPTPSLAGASKTPSDTEKTISRFIPNEDDDDSVTAARHDLVFAVHERVADAEPRFIGLVTLVRTTTGLPLAPPLVPAAGEPGALVVELAYMFLPGAWGRGLATEAVRAVVGAAREGGAAFWAPWESVWVRVVVNGRNGPSVRVMEKVGLRKMGVYKWEGERLWIGGEWAVKDDLVIFGGELR
jgi:RimJ/RimL family protein N-acetyltransferase